MLNPVAWRDEHVNLKQMFIAVRMNITEEQGSRACPMNITKAPCASDGDIIITRKGHFSEARSA
jgi:hypothetical protein